MTSTAKTSPWLHPTVLAGLGALLLSGGWAPWPTAWLAPLLFIGWVPYLVLERRLTLAGARKRRVFASTYLFLVLWNALTTWWVSYADLAAGIAAVVLNALLMCLPLMAFRQTKKRLGNRWGYLSLPVYWIAFEQLHLHWDLTWPWLTLGNGFAAAPQWVQWYEYTGFLGGSVWVWGVNLLFFKWLTHSIKNDELKIKNEELKINFEAAEAGAGNGVTPAQTQPFLIFNFQLLIPLLAIVLPISLSYLIGATYQEKGPTAEVVVIQPNFDPYVEKFEGGPKFIPSEEQLTRMLNLSDQHLTAQTRLVLWPETALEEAVWERTIESSPKIRRVREWLARHPGVALLTGITTISSYPNKEAASETARYRDDLGYYDYNNAAGYFASAGAPLALYHKSRLVPGVEKIPPILSSLLKNIDLGGFVGSYGSQTERTVYAAPANAPALRVAPIICYESIYGDFVGEYARNGATLLGLVTNDAWWHDSPGYRQLLSYGQLRCIETRRDLARSANTGFTGFINQKGEITQREPAWVPTASRASVHLNNEVTFYVRFGELIGRGAQVLAMLLLVFVVVRAVVGAGKGAVEVKGKGEGVNVGTGHGPFPHPQHPTPTQTPPPMPPDFLQLSHDLAALCRTTAQFIRQEAATFDRSKVELKGLHDLVSYVDQETERRLVAGLRQLLPEAGFITEEGTAGPDTHTEEFTWIIDPLDGTTNFVHGLPVYAISVALLHHKELVVGVVHEVNRDESFRAVRGSGAFCNDQPIHVTDIPDLNSSLIATGFPYKEFDKMSQFLQILGAFMTRSHGLRRLGSAAVDLAYVAAGRYEAFFEYNLNSYDVAAGILLVREAGGHVTQFLIDGDPLFGRELVASNGHLHAEMQATIGEFWQ